MAEQPMLGLHLENTIAMRRGEGYVAQCMGCGSLMAISSAIGTRPLSQLGACPGCASKRWLLQHVPVGPFSADWAHMLVDAAVAVTKREPGRHANLEAAIERAKSSTREYAVWIGSKHENTRLRGRRSR
jgi:hypothetical protein